MRRSSSRVLLIVAAFVLLLVPVAAIAAGGFTDVEDDSVFKADIAWLADAGVTKGCNPPTNDKFCPESSVTREQMAAFMHRLANNKIVNAKTSMDADNLDGRDSTAFADSGHNHDSDYLGVKGRAADSDLLDGKDSTAFVQKGEADSVSSSMITDSVGFAQVVTSTSKFLSPTPTRIISVGIEVPAPGYVVVQASFEARIDHTYDTANVCFFDVSADHTTMPSDISPHIRVPVKAPNGQSSFMSSASRSYPVAGAGTYDFMLMGRSDTAGCWVDNVVLTALFVPSSYDPS